MIAFDLNTNQKCRNLRVVPIVQGDSLMLIGKEMLSPFSSELTVNEPIEYLSSTCY